MSESWNPVAMTPGCDWCGECEWCASLGADDSLSPPVQPDEHGGDVR